MRQRKGMLVAALATAALMAACGGDDDDVNNNADNYDGTDAEVAQVVDEFASAGRDGDGEEVCDEIFTEALAKNVEQAAGQSCASEVEDNLPEGEYELEVDTLEVDGDTATVGVTDQDDNEFVLHIEKVDDAWRIARIPPS